MTIRFSTGLRNELASQKRVFVVLQQRLDQHLQRHSSPTTADSAVTGTLLGTVTISSGADPGDTRFGHHYRGRCLWQHQHGDGGWPEHHPQRRGGIHDRRSYDGSSPVPRHQHGRPLRCNRVGCSCHGQASRGCRYDVQRCGACNNRNHTHSYFQRQPDWRRCCGQRPRPSQHLRAAW